MRKELTELAESYGRSIMFADGHDNALVGYVTPEDDDWLLSVYNSQIIVKNLTDSGMTEDEAWEFFYFNIEGAYVGAGTPMFICH